MGSASKAQDQDESQSRSFIDPNQVPFLQSVRQQGQDLAQSQMQTLPGVLSQLTGAVGGTANDLFSGIAGQAGQFGPGVGQSISNLQGIGQSDIAQQLLGGLGGLDLNQLLQPGAQLGGQLNSLQGAIQQNLQATLGTIGGQATLAGQTGGDRQAFFSGQAGRDAQETFGREAGNLLASDLASRRQLGGVAAGLQLGELGILGDLLGLDATAQTAAGQLGLAQQGNNIGAGLSGIDAASSLFNLGLAPFQAQFNPLLNLANLIGSPTVLGSQFGSGSGTSTGIEIFQIA